MPSTAKTAPTISSISPVHGAPGVEAQIRDYFSYEDVKSLLEKESGNYEFDNPLVQERDSGLYLAS
jgi:hypothetical protein